DSDLAREVAAQRLVPEVAEVAGAAEEIEVSQHALAHARGGHALPGGGDPPDDFVARDARQVLGPATVIAVHVVENGQPDAAGLDLDQDLARHHRWPPHRFVADLAAPFVEHLGVHLPAGHGRDSIPAAGRPGD